MNPGPVNFISRFLGSHLHPTFWPKAKMRALGRNMHSPTSKYFSTTAVSLEDWIVMKRGGAEFVFKLNIFNFLILGWELIVYSELS